MHPPEVRTFRDLEVWSDAIDLVVDCYKLTERFPSSERYGLVSQIRRSATSIPSNVTEGHARRTRRAYLNHVNIALGSEAELETHVLVAVRLGFCTDDQVRELCERRARVGRRLTSLAGSLERSLIAHTMVGITVSCAVFWWWFSSDLVRLLFG